MTVRERQPWGWPHMQRLLPVKELGDQLARGEETLLGLGNVAVTVRNWTFIHLSGPWEAWLAYKLL